MRVSLIKIGARVSFEKPGKSGSVGEVLSIINVLLLAGVQVDVYTKEPSNVNVPDGVFFHDILTEYNSVKNDILIVINGNLTFFGGVEVKDGILNYYILNKFKGTVFYFLCDPNLPLKQTWNSIKIKDWGKKYNESDIVITRKDMICVTQSHNKEKIENKHKKCDIFFKDTIIFPFEKFPLVVMKDEEIASDHEFDLIYGGTYRGGRRRSDMIKYFFGNSLKTYLFGNIKYKDFNFSEIEVKSFNDKLPIFGDAVLYTDFIQKMSRGKSTIIIGDPIYLKTSNFAQRIYESIRAGNIVFIDKAYDPDKKIFNSSKLKDFLYVNTPDDIKKRLKHIESSNNPVGMFKYIVDLQRNDVMINVTDYTSLLRSILDEYK